MTTRRLDASRCRQNPVAPRRLALWSCTNGSVAPNNSVATVRNRTGQIESQQIDAGDVSAAFEDFDNVWNALTSREQAQVIAPLVARVEFDVADSTIAISFHPSAIKTLAEGNVEDAA